MEPHVQKTADFDPYYKWLGIRPEHQPPNHYRLLGLEIFEVDGEIVRAAAERQAAYLQTYKIGPQSELSQRLLNEVARAKVCLLDPARKAEYDRGLRAMLAPVQPPVQPIAAPPRAAAVIAPTPLAPITPVNPRTPPAFSPAVPSRKPLPRNRRVSWTPAIVISAIGCILAALAIALLAPTKQPVIRPTTDPPTPAPHLQPKETSAQKRPRASGTSDKVAGTANRSGKHAIPSSEQQQKGRQSISIEGHLTPSELLKAAIESKQPWQSYVLHQLAIDAALAGQELDIANQAIESLLVQFDVDDAGIRELRARVRAVESIRPREPESMPAKPPSRVHLPEQIPLPSGKPLSLAADDPIARGAAVEMFARAQSKDTGLFVFSKNARPTGVFVYRYDGREKFFDGPALVLYANGRPMSLLNYKNHRRDGVQYHWDVDGRLLVRAEYENGRPMGRIVQYRNGRAVLVEEWPTSQVPTRYRIETEPDRVIAEQVQGSDIAISDPFAPNESEWKQPFSSWWREHDRSLKQLERAVSLAAPKEKPERQRAVDAYREKLAVDSREGRDRILERLNTAQPPANSIP